MTRKTKIEVLRTILDKEEPGSPRGAGFPSKKSRILSEIESGSSIQTSPPVILLVDFLNLIRRDVSHDAKFRSIEELIERIENLAKYIHSMRDFHRIYLVTKSFSLVDCNYGQIINIFFWSFCKLFPEWRDRVCLVLVNGLDSNDREPDDRALFILYKELTKTTSLKVIIFSNDRFESIKTHFFRKVKLSFFCAKRIADTWIDSKIILCHEGYYQQTDILQKSNYLVYHLCNGETEEVSVSLLD